MPISITAPLLFDIVDSLCPGRERQVDTFAFRELIQAHRVLTRASEADDGCYRVLKQLLIADQEMSPEDIRQCLEFLYSHLVSKYQGCLAEYLTAMTMSAWLSECIGRGLLGPEVVFVGGETIRERSIRSKKRRWLKGADGLLIAEGSDDDKIYLAGVVEIKSYSTTFARVEAQLEAHIERLQRGLRIDDSSWSPEQIIPLVWKRQEGWIEGGGREDLPAPVTDWTDPPVWIGHSSEVRFSSLS